MAHHTPLHDTHIKLGAKMVDFAGWDMPVQYPDGILKEHDANRKGVSIFDCSHMGEFIIEGDHAEKDLERIVTQSITGMPVKTCRYGMMLNEKGGTVDDLIVYRMTDKVWMLVVNAANIAKDRRNILKHIARSVRFHDISTRTAKLDVQGPLSREVLLQLLPGIEKLEYYTFDEFDLCGERVIVSRTGYTGELGFEIYCPWDTAQKVWDAVLADSRVKPTGLGVRDVLRIEATYPLYGHELSDTISPLEAGLKRFVDMNKDFVGKPALLKMQEEGQPRSLFCFVSENRRAPRAEHKIFTSDGVEAGDVVSGTFSPALGRGIGIGFLKKEFTSMGKNIIFGDTKLKANAEIVPRPFYKEGSLKK
jgi:aminomethyltransferase